MTILRLAASVAYAVALMPSSAVASLRGSSGSSSASSPAAPAPRERSVHSPEDFVNVLGGTDSRYDMSHGNTLPLIARPWGFNSWAAYTNDDPTWQGWWFHPDDRRIFGVKCTHQPSPWIEDYGQFLVSASLTDPDHDGVGQSSAYSSDDSVFKPSYFRADLQAYAAADGTPTTLELTPTSHGAVFRVTFPKYETESGPGFPQTRRIMITLNGGSDAAEVGVATDGATLITGVSTKNSGGVSPGVSFGHFFAVAIYAGLGGDQVIAPKASHADSRSAWVDFCPKNPASARLTLRIGTSFISKEQALLNLQREVGVQYSFDDVLAASQAEWDEVLGRVDVRAPSEGYSPSERQEMYATFYSAMYRASLFPRDISEVNADGQTVHWSPYANGGPFAGPLATDSGFWDAYSTVYPMLSIVNRPRLGTMIEGWLNAYREGGWLPKWASPGYRGSMVGTMGDVTLADAIVKKIPGFDAELAYEAIRKDAFETPPQNSSGVGRLCLDPYLRYGYVPRGSPMATGGQCTEVLSRNLLYLQADYAVSEAAKVLGHEEDASVLRARAANYGVLFDGADTGMLRSIDVKTGKFSEPFDQFSWGGDYTEAGPWQYRFHVPYDPAGFRELFAKHGKDLCSELKRAQTQPGVFHLGGYGTLIHEQTELMQNCWGQYSHNNQPVHHMLYMFIASDAEGFSGQCAQAGQSYLRRAQLELYRPGRSMFTGDEDNGQMSSWFLLSSMGLYALSPGSPDYVLGTPLFEEVHVPLEGGASLTVLAEGNSRTASAVHRITWNGQDLPAGASTISYHTLMQGGELKFYMK